MMLYTKYDSSWPSSFRLEIWKLHFENLFFDPVTYFCNQSELFQQFWKGTISGSKEEVVCSFPYIMQCRSVTPGRGQFWTQGDNLNLFFDPVTYLCNKLEPFDQFCKGPPKDQSCFIEAVHQSTVVMKDATPLTAPSAWAGLYYF